MVVAVGGAAAPTASAPFTEIADSRPVTARLLVVWALALFNVLPYTAGASILPIPGRVGQLLTQASLGAALVAALTLNGRRVFRPSLFLSIYSTLAVLGLVASVRAPSIGYPIRAGRFLVFVAVLWLLTPFWDARRLTVARVHQWCLGTIVGLVIAGAVLSPGRAFAFEGRLQGTIWPMPPTQVAHYASVLVGLVAIQWMCRRIVGKQAVLVLAFALPVLLLTHTRTALLALAVGLTLAVLSLFVRHRRARRAFAVAIVVLAAGALLLTPLLISWLSRGQDAQAIANLTGRTNVWSAVVSEDRPRTDLLFGSGISNGSFDGLPIDNGWLATYVDQGLVGDLLLALGLLTLVVISAFRPSGPARAIALFLVGYCFSASFTEAGLGGATTYLLDLVVAASVLVADRSSSRPAAIVA